MPAEVWTVNCPLLSPTLLSQISGPHLLCHYWSLNWVKSLQGSLKLHLTAFDGASSILCQA